LFFFEWGYCSKKRGPSVVPPVSDENSDWYSRAKGKKNNEPITTNKKKNNMNARKPEGKNIHSIPFFKVTQ